MNKITSLIIFLFIANSITAQGPGDILDMCIVLELNTDSKSDLSEAAWMFPFMMGRSVKLKTKELIPHYTFNLPNNAQSDASLNNGIEVIGIRPYKIEEKSLEELSESLAANEIAFTIAPWPEKKLGKNDSAIFAFFPSKNKYKVTTDHLIVNKSLPLPEQLVAALQLPFKVLEPGKYPIIRKEFEN